MFDLIAGIPVHPLVVHAIVVLLPVALVGTMAIAVRPKWRVTYGPLVVGAALASTILCPIATSSGEALEKRVGDPGNHAALGDTLVWFSLALLLVSAALVWLQRRANKSGPERAASGQRLLTGVAALSVLVAVAAGVQVYRVGDSGAHAVWDDVPAATSGK